MHIVVGLGNPGEEYKDTRHNAGRIAAAAFVKKNDFPDFVQSAKYASLLSQGEVDSELSKTGTEKVTVLLPETFMNKSGKSVSDLVNSSKKAEKLIVIQDDLDMPIGAMKIVFNRGSGGHKGIESIKRAIKTEAFVRVKIGICPTTPTGKPKKPTGEKLMDFIVGEFKPAELDEIKKVAKRAADAVAMIISEGRERAANTFN
ncbi:MAG TPA: aminoacyl-tRNA hydrolase [Candidatus Paceibacterota bacterium]